MMPPKQIQYQVFHWPPVFGRRRRHRGCVRRHVGGHRRAEPWRSAASSAPTPGAETSAMTGDGTLDSAISWAANGGSSAGRRDRDDAVDRRLVGLDRAQDAQALGAAASRA